MEKMKEIELWDIYDKNRNKTGRTIVRDSNQKLQDGEYHLVVEALIINSKNEILISKRAPNKEKYPLYWEFNGGSVKSGEDSKHGILRELREELGLNFDENEAIFYKEIRKDDAHVFKDNWIFKKDIDLSELHFTDNEVIDAKWTTLDEIHKMEKEGKFILNRAVTKDEFNKILNNIDKICFM